MSSVARKPLILGTKTYKDITDDICAPVEAPATKRWFGMLLGAEALFLFYLVHIAIIIGTGMGLLGTNSPVGWGTMIITFGLLDWYWSRRNVDFCDPLSVPSEVENVGCSFS